MKCKVESVLIMSAKENLSFKHRISSQSLLKTLVKRYFAANVCNFVGMKRTMVPFQHDLDVFFGIIYIYNYIIIYIYVE